MNDERRTTLANAVDAAMEAFPNAPGSTDHDYALFVVDALFSGPVPLAYPADMLEQVGWYCSGEHKHPGQRNPYVIRSLRFRQDCESAVPAFVVGSGAET